MPISKNTKSLAGHPIGVSPQTTGILRQLEVERSRANYQYRIKLSDQKAMKLRQYAYKLVYRWTREEKRQLLQSYGEYSLVKNPNDDEELNRQLVETLLVNLSEGELNSIVQEVNYTERELVNNIQKLNKRHDAYMDRPVTAATNPNRMTSTAAYQSAGTAAKKAGFTPSDNAFNISRILRKELKTIFKNYTKQQLGQLANDLGIDFEDGDAPAYVQDQIIREIGKYVALVTGKTKGMLNMSTKTANAARKVLRLTSFAWTAGEKPLSSRERAYLIAKAKQIKAEMDARSDILSKETKWYDLKSKLNNRSADSKRGAKNILKKFPDEKVDALRSIPYQDLLNRAAELGIYISNDMNQDQIIAKILLKEQDIVKKQKNLAKKIEKARKKGSMEEVDRLISKSNAIKKLQERSMSGTFSPKGLLDDETGAKSGVPVIKLDDNGSVVSPLIDVAVPVVIVGQVKGGENKAIIAANNKNNTANQLNTNPIMKLLNAKRKADIEKAKTDKSVEINSRFYKTTKFDSNGNPIETRPLNDEELVSLYERIKNSSKKDRKNLLKELLDSDVYSQISNPNGVGLSFDGANTAGITPGPIDVVAQGGGGIIAPAVSGTIDGSAFNSTLLSNLFNKKKTLPPDAPLDIVKSYSAKWGKGKDGHYHLYDSDTGKALNDKIFFNKASRDLGFETIKRGPVTPVWLVNGFTEYLNNITEEGFKDLVTSTSAIYTYLSTAMPVLFQGLQQAGTSFNMAGPAAIAAGIMENVVAGLDVAFDKLRSTEDDIKTQKYATGGTGKAAKPQKISLKEIGGYSQFMAGDSPNGKENAEMVSIDWNNRQFAVKPTQPTVSNVKKLSDNERLTAFGVSFREATVKYDAKISGETEDNVALKVYPVTPGINDKVEIDGKEISLIELMSGLYGSVVNIEGILGQSLEVSKIIAAKPVGTVSTGNSSVQEETFPSNLDSILRGE